MAGSLWLTGSPQRFITAKVRSSNKAGTSMYIRVQLRFSRLAQLARYILQKQTLRKKSMAAIITN